MSEYRAAVIGLGIMGRRMVGNLRRHPRFALAGAWDPAAAARDVAAKEFADVPIVDDAGALIASAATDLVYVACPPQWHKEYALAAIAAGKPVYCEKPLGIDVGQSEDLVARLEAASIPNVVNFVQASSAALERTQAALGSGAAGAVHGIDIVVQYQQWPRAWQTGADWLRFRAQGGYTREVISHFVFVAERLLGPAEVVWSRPTYPGDETLCESHIQARLECAGVPVSIFGSSGGVGPDRQEVTVWCGKRSHRISDFHVLEVSEGDGWTMPFPPDPDPRTTTLQRQLDNAANWLAGAPHVLATARDALSVQKIIEAMLAG